MDPYESLTNALRALPSVSLAIFDLLVLMGLGVSLRSLSA
jgi:hypothetical protein